MLYDKIYYKKRKRGVMLNKFSFNKKYFTISLYVLLVIIIAITYEKTIGNFPGVIGYVGNIINIILTILTPFLYGLLIAYLLNSGVKTIENKLLRRIKFLKDKRNITRPVSILMMYVIVIGVVVWIIIYLIPEIAESLTKLFDGIKASITYINVNSTNFYKEDGIINSTLKAFNDAFATDFTVKDLIDKATEPVIRLVTSIPSFINDIFNVTMKIVNGTVSLFLGLVIAFYMLMDKEGYAKIFTKITYLIFKKPLAEKILKISNFSNITFEKFFIGKTIDSIIIGWIFFIVCTIANGLLFEVPYIVLLSLIVGITNMIPYFGPFIGGVPVVIIVFLYSPTSPLFLWMALFIFVLQQFDGLFLGPKILGDSIGLKPIGVIFAIVVGGYWFGALGMFFGVPFFAVISTAVGAFIDRKYFTKYRPLADAETDLEAEAENTEEN